MSLDMRCKDKLLYSVSSLCRQQRLWSQWATRRVEARSAVKATGGRGESCFRTYSESQTNHGRVQKRRLGHTKEGPGKREFPFPLLSSCSDYSCPCTSGKGRDVLDLRRSDWLVGAATFRSLESYDETKYSLFRLKRSLPEALGQWPTFSDSASWSAEPLCGLSAGKPRLTEGFRSRSLPAATPFRCLF